MDEFLVDKSVWIDYFRSGKYSDKLNLLIDSHRIVVNDLIHTELIPFLIVRRSTKVIKSLKDLPRIPLQINWESIIEMQTECLKEGINGIGISDLIIAQNAKQKDVAVYSLDKHFVFLQNILKIKLYPETD